MKNFLLALVTLFIGHASFACNSGFTFAVGPSNYNYSRVYIYNKSVYNTPPGKIAYTFINYGDGTNILDYTSDAGYSHQYPGVGNYQVMMAVVIMDSSSLGKTILCTDTTWQNINITNDSCNAFLIHNGTGSSDITFNGNQDNIKGVNYIWDFGDNTPFDTARMITHYYAATGNYIVKLTVSTSTCSHTASTEIQVDSIFDCNDLPNNIDVYYNLKRRIAIVNTLNIPEHSIIATRTIDYGDGTPLSKLAYHTYAQPGTYTVTRYSQWKKTDSSMVCFDTTRKAVTVKDDTVDCSKAWLWFGVRRNTFYRSITTTVRLDTLVPPHPNMMPGTFYFDYGDGTPLFFPPSLTHTFPDTTATFNVTFYVIWRSADSAAICTTSVVKPIRIAPYVLDCSHVKAVLKANIDPVDTMLVSIDTAGSIGPPDVPSAVDGFSFDYGDGNGYRAGTINRYRTAGTYQIKLQARWYNPTDNTYCQDTASTFVTIKGTIPPFNCASSKPILSINFNPFRRMEVLANGQASIRPSSSTYSPYEFTYSFDNGSFTPAGSKLYTSPGVYKVVMMTNWQDAYNSANTCRLYDTVSVRVGFFDCNFGKALFYPMPSNNGLSVTINNSLTTKPLDSVIGKYTYQYGDGSAITDSITHTYATAGRYIVHMFAEWTDPVDSSKCQDTSSQLVIIGPIQFDCAKGNAAFSHTVQIKTATIYDLSTKPSINAIATYTFNYGDGTAVTAATKHNYAAPGTYNVHMYAAWTDRANSNTTCYDTAIQSIVILASPVNCNNGSASFTASVSSNTVDIVNSSIAPEPYLVQGYTYNYGDGTGVLTTTSHTYATAGIYSVSLFAKWLDPADSITVICMDTMMQSVTILPLPIDCDSAHASFSVSNNNYTVTITNNSASPSSSLTPDYSYNYGDGSSTNQITSHTYSAAGTYTIFLFANWVDHTNTVICSDTSTQNVTITQPPNTIQGTVRGTVANASYKVWLISYDTASLTAIDSAVVTTPSGVDTASYSFNNEPNDDYFIKAQDISTTPVHIPTYSINSVYWSGAAHVYHTGAPVYGQDIIMLPGTPPSGPGFIGGSISSGANRLARRTGNDVTDILILLRNSAGVPIASVRTDANGHYYFANIANGSYDVYPELPGYGTIVFPVSVGTGSDTAKDINFHINTTTKIIAPAPTSINKVGLLQQPAIYPNPSSGIINITGLQKGNTKIIVTDISGRVLLQTAVNDGSDTLVNLSKFGSGVYFINIKAEGVNYSNKIVLQH